MCVCVGGSTFYKGGILWSFIWPKGVKMIKMIIFEPAHVTLVLRRSMNALTRLCI